MDGVSIVRRLRSACLRRGTAAHGDQNEKRCTEQHLGSMHW